MPKYLVLISLSTSIYIIKNLLRFITIIHYLIFKQIKKSQLVIGLRSSESLFYVMPSKRHPTSRSKKFVELYSIGVLYHGAALFKVKISSLISPIIDLINKI